MKDLKLHPVFGVNPTQAVCWWCQMPSGEIALLGDKYDGEAPMHMVIDRVPCPSCQKAMDQGILINELNDDDRTPTGRWVVLTVESFNRFGLKPDLKAKILKARRMSADQKLFTKILLDSSAKE